ncbi:MAG: hypothetical protein QNI91_14330 [Arenicellales bacterium]|nr:hypothetical protein [Arenicellales bacterium]
MTPANNIAPKIQNGITNAGEFNADPQMKGAYVLAWSRYRHYLGWFGLGLALPFFIWVLLSWLGATPSMVEVFGIAGIRIPASITIAGLLFAAVGFHEV